MASLRNRRVGIRNVHSRNRGNPRAHSMKVAESNKRGKQLLWNQLNLHVVLNFHGLWIFAYWWGCYSVDASVFSKKDNSFKFVFIEDVNLLGRATKEYHENWANINSFIQWYIFSLLLVTHREFGTSPIKPAVQEFSPSPRIQEQRAYEQRVQASNHLARQAKQLKQRVGYLTQQVRTTTLFILWIYFRCFLWSTNWKQFLVLHHFLFR